MKNERAFIHVMIFFVVFLVVSITPVSAVQINQMINPVCNETKMESFINASGEADIPAVVNFITSDEFKLINFNKQLNSHTTKIENYWNDLLDNYWWYAFPIGWGYVYEDFQGIYTETEETMKIIVDIKPIIERINETSNKSLGEIVREENETIDESARHNAEFMSSNLEKDLKVGFNIVPAKNLESGDIIQYKSQDKFYRYLQFIKLDNSSVILKSSYDGIIEVSTEDFNKHAKLKLTSTKENMNNTRIINHAQKIQKKELNNKIDKLKNQKEEANELRNIGVIVMISGFVLVALILILVTIYQQLASKVYTYYWSTFFDIIDITKFIGIIMGIITLFMGVSATIGLIANEELKVINEELGFVYGDLDDFNSYLNSSLNHAPIAENLNLTMKENMSLNGTLNASDVDGDLLEYGVVSGPAHGSLNVGIDGRFVYTPDSNYVGMDNFTYKANDGLINSNNATVTINIDPYIPPVASDMNYTITNNQTLNETFNVTNPYEDKLVFKIESKPQHGTLKLDLNGLFFVYIPYANYTGNDSFTYKMNNGFIDSNIANITINIKTSF